MPTATSGANTPAGNYAITARALWGAGLSVTSAPVNLTVPGPVQGPPVQIRQTSATQIELSWPDDGNTYEVVTQASLRLGSWTAAGGTPTLSSGRCVQTLPAANRKGFFRLHKL